MANIFDFDFDESTVHYIMYLHLHKKRTFSLIAPVIEAGKETKKRYSPTELHNAFAALPGLDSLDPNPTMANKAKIFFICQFVPEGPSADASHAQKAKEYDERWQGSAEKLPDSAVEAEGNMSTHNNWNQLLG
ncbi:MAG: hypothetical protein Q9186_005918 [Xanthomendoza sp. 1 TL-2023]